jgi:RNA polymerase sigma-70 factor (ECF subfamily)
MLDHATSHGGQPGGFDTGIGKAPAATPGPHAAAALDGSDTKGTRRRMTSTRARRIRREGPIWSRGGPRLSESHRAVERCVAGSVSSSAPRDAEPSPLFGPGCDASGLDDTVDQAMFEQLYRDISPRLYRFVRLAEPSEAEDIASEVWVAVSGYLGRFRGDVNGFEALVFTIARRRISDHRRRRAFRRTDTVANEAFTDRAADIETDHEAIDQLRTRATLEELFRALPRSQVEVVVLRVVFGLPSDQVAALLGRSPGNVRILQHRALKRLRA